MYKLAPYAHVMSMLLTHFVVIKQVSVCFIIRLPGFFFLMIMPKHSNRVGQVLYDVSGDYVRKVDKKKS